jgi:hypothetical protein
VQDSGIEDGCKTVDRIDNTQCKHISDTSDTSTAEPGYTQKEQGARARQA